MWLQGTGWSDTGGHFPTNIPKCISRTGQQPGSVQFTCPIDMQLPSDFCPQLLKDKHVKSHISAGLL